MRVRVAFSAPVAAGLLVAMAGLPRDARAQDAPPEAPFRCSISAAENKPEVTISLENPSATGVMSDGVGSLILLSKAADPGGSTRFLAPVNLVKGKAASPGEDVSLTLGPNETRTLTLSFGALRWGRHVPGLRLSLDSLKKIVPASTYDLTLRVGSVTCAPPGPVSVAP